MALRVFQILIVVVLLTGCGPEVSTDELPMLPSVPTESFLGVVAEQLDGLAAAVTDDPLSAKKAGALGMAYLAYRQHEAAEVMFRRARLLQPRKFEWIYFHAETLTRLGRFDESVTLLQQAVAEKPAYAPARTKLGVAHMQLGELEQAESHLRAVVDNEPGNAAGRLALARLYLRADQPAQAREHLEYLVDTIGHAGSIYFALADALRRTGARDEAAQYLALSEKYRGLGVPVDDPLLREVSKLDLGEKPLLRQARRLNQLGQPGKAMELMHLALERNPDSHLTHAALVGAYGAMKQFDKVDEHYRLALESAPATAPLLRNLGRARFHEQRLAEAQQALEQALELDPHDSSALAWLGLVRLQQKDIEQGLALLEKALEKNPREALARHNLVDVLRRQGRHAEALVYMKELVVIEDKHSPRVWRQMGESYLKLGQTDQARDALTAAVASAERLNDDAEARRSATVLNGIAE